MPNFLVSNNFYQGTSNACIVDLTPPAFAGVNFLDVESRGQIRAGWAVATDPTAPIRYEIYIKASTATGLFNTANIIAVSPNLQYDIFNLPDGSFLQNGVTYFVGVRAIDGVNNRDNNTVSMSVISTGILTAIDVYESKAAFSTNDSYDFVVTAWATKNSSRAKAPGAVMGPASYQVFNKLGVAVAGATASVGSPNAEGLYIFAPVAVALSTTNTHYEIRITVNIDGEDRVNFQRIEEATYTYQLNGTVDINYSGQLVGSFWAEGNDGVVNLNLGTATWKLYTANGTFTGVQSPSPITADVNGFFAVPAFTFPTPLDPTTGFIVRVDTTVANQPISRNIIVGDDPMSFAAQAIFSINASNQFEATFWALRNDEMSPTATLGTASYIVYDKTGVAVAGLTQSGITADAQGYYHITPVSAVLLTDLTHYKAKVTMTIQGQVHSSTHGFTLLGN